MILYKTEVEMPEGYLMVPLPKDLKGYGDSTITVEVLQSFEDLDFKDQVYLVLSKLSECESINDWKTSHSAFKGATDYALGLYKDRFSFIPISLPYPKGELYGVTVRTSDLRLYYKVNKTPSKSV